MSSRLQEHRDIIINTKHTILDCYRLLDKTGHRVLICVENGRVVGIVMDGDIRRGILAGMRLEDSILRVMNENPFTVKENVSQNSALALMKKKDIDILPVVDKNGRFVTVYVLSELLKTLAIPNSAVIMAGGFGKRLMPLTKNIPKPLLKVGKKPIIEHVISNLTNHGIENFFITVNYKSEAVKNHLKDGKNLGVKIDYLEEKKQLGTVGAISLLKEYKIEFPFIVMNGDILTRFNIRRMLNEHEKNNSLLTVALAEYEHHVPYGVIAIDNQKITGIKEKPIYSFFINAGIYCMSPAIIDLIPKNKYYDITMLINFFLKKNFPINYFVMEEYWKDIGNPADYMTANHDYNNGIF